MSDQVIAWIITAVLVAIVSVPFVWLKVVEDHCNTDEFDW